MPIIILLLLLSLGAHGKTLPASNFKATQDFIQKMVDKHQFDQGELLSIFTSIELPVAEKTTQKKIKKTAKRKPMSWDRYRALFLTQNRIDRGVEFWQENQALLTRAQNKYNVPAQIIVAILGIETNYGNKQGTHPTLQAIAQRAFSNHRRKKFYTKELEDFLLLVRENNIAPLQVKGSYAGALGYAQFIPSSYRHYAIDFDNDKQVDLFNSRADAIGSIANYFDKHHWHDGGEIAYPITLDSAHLKHAKRGTNKPKKTAQYWRQQGIEIANNIDDKTKVAFVRLPQDQRVDTYLTLWNFYVLTRYNHDNRYAMAAYQLSKEIYKSYQQTNNP